jgi:hypothetical protein
VGEEQNRVVHVVDEFVWLFEKRAVTGDGEFDDVFAGSVEHPEPFPEKFGPAAGFVCSWTK